MRRTLAACFTLLCIASLNSAHAGVSGGHYTPSRQHCSNNAEAWVNKGKAEPNCYTAVFTVSDGNGHEYLVAGGHQTGSGFVHLFDVWIDPGQGTRYGFTVDTTTQTITPTPGAPSTQPAPDPTKGLTLYFGADDNLDAGEHDGAYEIGNGPSDGGGIAVSITPEAAQAWVDALTSADIAQILAKPLPVAEAGAGACADGICFPGLNAVRTTIFQGGKPNARRFAVDYSNFTFPPADCSGASAKEQAKCVDATHPNGLIDWFNESGEVYLMPGISIYEDPDPQKSALDPYPLPAFYFGACGFVLGGGGGLVFSGPGTNSAGQISVLNPLCSF